MARPGLLYTKVNRYPAPRCCGLYSPCDRTRRGESASPPRFASAGERGQGMIAQDPTKHPGSIIRINIDGTIPKDNPKFLKR